MGGPKKKRMKLDSQSAGKSSRTRRTGLSNGTGVGSESSWPERSLQDLPDNVLTSVFRHLGLDRLLAIQGKSMLCFLRRVLHSCSSFS